VLWREVGGCRKQRNGAVACRGTISWGGGRGQGTGGRGAVRENHLLGRRISSPTFLLARAPCLTCRTGPPTTEARPRTGAGPCADPQEAKIGAPPWQNHSPESRLPISARIAPPVMALQPTWEGAKREKQPQQVGSVMTCTHSGLGQRLETVG
jgi:hypothetical protein